MPAPELIPLQAIRELVLRWANEQAWGEIVLSYEEGQVVQVRESRVKKAKDFKGLTKRL